MTPERWQRIELLYHSALERDPESRSAFLAEVCRDDEELRHEVESLLRQHGSMLERPAWEETRTRLTVRSGAQLGPYRIDALLGAGGMGEVFRATDTRLHRSVAIKILPPDKVADPDRKRRFMQEARAASALNHPHIITLHDIASDNGVDFLVMEYVPGKPLDQLIASKGLPLAEVIDYATQIASALAAAHAAGIVHRDIKPANIIVTEEGQVKVLDFGLAKLAERAPDPEGETRTMEPKLTEAGMVMGTLTYMSPEQARAEEVDARTDLFSFGAVLYEMAAGRRAFLKSLDWTTPPVAPLQPELRPIVLKLLEVDKDLRYQHASEVRADLQRLKRDSDVAQVISSAQPGAAKRWKTMTAAAAALVALAAAGYFYFPRGPKLTDKDTIVLADFTNATGDPVFDGALRQGLAAALEQSPFLSLISDDRIQQTLSLMGRPADARLTPALAREVCERIGSAAVLEGTIEPVGSQYVLGLRAKKCRTGEVLDDEQVQAGKKEDVLNSLGQIASKFRTRVGESLSTVEKHDTPLEEATTPSLEALKAYSAAAKHLTSDHDLAAGVPLFQRAIEIDPKFALAYASLGFTYGLLGQFPLASENNRKAYELRDRVSDRERFYITATYHTQVTGDLETARQICELWMQTYPRETVPHGILGSFVYPTFGQYDKGVEVDAQLVKLNPGFAIGYLQLAFNNQFLGHLADADKTLQQASDRKLEIPELLLQRYDVAFLKGDQAGMDREVARAQNEPDAQDMLFDRQGFVLAYSGHLKQAENIARRAVDLNQEPAQRGKQALFEIGPALWKAFFGNTAAATKEAWAAADLSKDRDVEYGAAFTLAFAGESSRSRELANDLEKRFPEDTAVRFMYLPAIRALLELHEGKPAKAIERLQPALRFDRAVPPSIAPAFIGPFYTVYVRGLAFLAAQQGADAAAEFQKVIDGRSIVVSDPVGALAHLQLGRALALSRDKMKAKIAYQDFLNLWKDADPDIPILNQAKSEYAALTTR